MLELQPGQVVSGFKVKAKIGKGGMGAVYLVHDKGLGVDRAFKVIALAKESAGPVEDEELVDARERFSREARTLARLRHPHIIPVHSVGEVAGTPYLVMTHFPSLDLRNWLSTNPSLDRVVAAAKQITSALAYAHKQGVLHRDIKPSAVKAILDHLGLPSVPLPFGRARALQGRPSGSERSSRPWLLRVTPAHARLVTPSPLLAVRGWKRRGVR